MGSDGKRRVVGVDLSLTSTAVAARVIESEELHVIRIRSTGAKTDSLSEHITRLIRLSNQVVAAVRACSPELVAMEDMMFGTSRDTSAHRRSGLWWMVASLLRHHGTPMVAVPPSTLKKWATGKGNASKDMVLSAAVRRFPQVGQNDEADAAMLADMASYLLTGQPSSKARDATVSKLPPPTLPVSRDFSGGRFPRPEAPDSLGIPVRDQSPAQGRDS